MTPEQQRIAIAEACGFRAIDVKTWHGWDHRGIEMPGDTPLWVRVPDYPGDLNACHEMEKVLIKRNDWELCDYVHKLHAATNGWPALATAAQRCEAFLRTLNLYIE